LTTSATVEFTSVCLWVISFGLVTDSADCHFVSFVIDTGGHSQFSQAFSEP
jgi:hypothetical protein